MVKKADLKGFPYEEIKEMISCGKLEMSSLDSEFLRGLMDYETDLLCLGEGDVDIISNCADILCERDKDMMSHEDFMAVVRKTLDKQTVRKRFSLKRALAVAAAVACLLVGSAVVASALGFNLFGFVDKIARKPAGTKWEEGGITIQNGGESKVYSTIEEAMEKENLDIMYPSSFPDGVVVKIIRVNKLDDSKNIHILTENNDITIFIQTNVALTDDEFEDEELYTKNGVDYILFEDDEECKYVAFCNVNGCAYTIQAKEYEDLIYIIENMEDNKK